MQTAVISVFDAFTTSSKNADYFDRFMYTILSVFYVPHNNNNKNKRDNHHE